MRVMETHFLFLMLMIRISSELISQRSLLQIQLLIRKHIQLVGIMIVITDIIITQTYLLTSGFTRHLTHDMSAQTDPTAAPAVIHPHHALLSIVHTMLIIILILFHIPLS